VGTASATFPSRSGALRLWAACSAMLGAIFVLGIASDVADKVVVCHTELRTSFEPEEDWRTWPVVPDFGGLRFEGYRETHYDKDPFQPAPVGGQDVELDGEGVCPHGGVPLGRWFKRGPEPTYLRSPRELQLHARGGVFVVSGKARPRGEDAPEAELFVAAFRRETFRRRVFRDTPLLALAFAWGLAGVIVGAVVACRAMLVARRYGDPARYKPGVRDRSGSITFDDGTAPVAPSATTLGAPGPVLVEAATARPWSFRTAASTRARRVVTGDAVILLTEARARAVDTLRYGAVWGGIFLGVSALVAFAMSVLEGMAHVAGH
jgi:hypothetical protein